MRTSRRLALGGVVAALVMVGAACAGGDDETAAPAASKPGGAETTQPAEPADDAPPAATAGCDSIDAATVAEIFHGKFPERPDLSKGAVAFPGMEGASACIFGRDAGLVQIIVTKPGQRLADFLGAAEEYDENAAAYKEIDGLGSRAVGRQTSEFGTPEADLVIEEGDVVYFLKCSVYEGPSATDVMSPCRELAARLLEA